jgi:broad specificity phosphatase PhoE
MLKGLHKDDEVVMIVTHGLTIMALISKLFEEDFGDVNENLPGNSSAVIIDVSKEGISHRGLIKPRA